MTEAAKSLMVVTGKNGPPSLETAANQLGVKPEAIDRGFGFVLIDPKKQIYSVLVELPLDDPRVFSNPKIVPFDH
jgi:hypothetical protein